MAQFLGFPDSCTDTDSVEAILRNLHNDPRNCNKIDNVYEGVYFEIVIMSRSPGTKKVPSILVKPEEPKRVSTGPAGHCRCRPSDSVQQLRRSKDNYNRLMKRVIETLSQLREQYKGTTYTISLVKRKEKPLTDGLTGLCYGNRMQAPPPGLA